MEQRYKKLNQYYKGKFGERTLKICVDGSFTCPNRDGTCGKGGCIFCSEKGSGELIKESSKSISEQIKEYLNSYRAERANKFIVYFQNFSNTYDSIENLNKKYYSSLIDERIVGISIATRPDCINEEIAKLIKAYSDKYYVSVELGLQTVDDTIGRIINRGYSTEQFIKAVELLNKYEIDVVVHIMCGLPGEKREKFFLEKGRVSLPERSKEVHFAEEKGIKISFEVKKGFIDLFNEENLMSGKYVPQSIINTVSLINKLKIQGIKIHSTYVVKNTKLNEMYEKGKYIPLEFDEYLAYLTYIITHLNENIVIHRICADAPIDILVAPAWNAHKKWVLNSFEIIMRENDLWQGKFEKNLHTKKLNVIL